ncbi:hypothetical protein L3i22_066970 [Actinoplanes sp. L3-i22]|nr:hypothetical protein L3i22_066970 [Actinoplanes sp. L3-i22]
MVITIVVRVRPKPRVPLSTSAIVSPTVVDRTVMIQKEIVTWGGRAVMAGTMAATD